MRLPNFNRATKQIDHVMTTPSVHTITRAQAGEVEATPVIDWRHDSPHEHLVQFYDNDEFLISTISRFAQEGLSADETIILIATQAHLGPIGGRLLEAGFNLAALTESGRYVALDAAEALATFMVNGSPDAARFEQHIGRVVANAVERGERVRAFGEMVAVLWEEGATQSALRLESLWNELAGRFAFTLCCAYPMKGFPRGAHSEAFLHVCNAHTHVVPAESYNEHSSPADRLRTVAVLQQKARALEAEVAERRRTEDALRRRKEELTAFAENAPIGLHWVGPDGIILWANTTELEMLGYEPAEYLGHHIAEFHADPAAVDDMLVRLCRGERLRSYEARLRCKSGAIKSVMIDSSAFWDNGRFVHTQCFTHDVTRQKRAEQQLAATRDALAGANENLEHQVFERTASLREAVAQLEEFSYTVSHDLRAPLRGMQVYSQALLEDHANNLDAEARHCLQRIAENSSRLDRMVTDVLAFSRISRSELQLHRVSLTKIVQDVIQQHPGMRPPNSEIRLEPLHDVLGNEPLVEQILSNLLSNAVKFVVVGEIPRVRLWSEKVDGGVRLWVEDNGIGVSPLLQNRLFRLFERLHPNLPYEGTGIGLAIVRKAATRMNGEVGVESNTPHGSRFWIRLPAA
jgi:PAS domain S-box-containing protein